MTTTRYIQYARAHTKNMETFFVNNIIVAFPARPFETTNRTKSPLFLTHATWAAQRKLRARLDRKEMRVRRTIIAALSILTLEFRSLCSRLFRRNLRMRDGSKEGEGVKITSNARVKRKEEEKRKKID